MHFIFSRQRENVVNFISYSMLKGDAHACTAITCHSFKFDQLMVG